MPSPKSSPRPHLFGAVFQHEARLFRRDKGVIALLLLIALWLGVAVFIGLAQQQKQSDVLERLRAADVEFIQNEIKEFAADPQGWRKSPLASGYRLKQRLSLQPGPLATLDVGQSDLRPSVHVLATDWEDFFLVPGPLRNETILQIGRFDVSFVAVYLLPLVVIALTFNLLAGDREKGTLRLLLAQPVSASTLLMAALLLRFLVLSVVAIGLATALLLLTNGMTTETLPRFALWSVVVMAYLAFWFALSAFVIAMGGKSFFNALALFTCWIFLAVGVPGMISLVTETRHPVPPRSDVMREVNIMRDNASKNWRTNDIPFRVFYKDFPELLSDTVTMTPTQFRDTVKDNIFQGRVRMANQYTVEKTARKAAEPHRTALNRQIELVQKSRLLSPVIAVREGLMDIAGAGDARYQQFENQATRFWSNWRYKFFKHQFQNISMTVDDYRNIRWFQFQEESTRGVAARVLPGVIATSLLTLLLLLASLVLLRRNQSPLPFS